MLKAYPKFKKNQFLKFYSSLSSKEQKELNDYLDYRKVRAKQPLEEESLMDIRRDLLHVRFCYQKPLSQLDLKELRDFMILLNGSYISSTKKNDIKINLKGFLKWKFEDWSKRFSNLDDIKLFANVRNEKKLNASAILDKKDIEDIMKHETKIFWKALFFTQYEAGLRTKEVRLLKWDDIKFNVDESISEISIFATKTKSARVVFVKDATFYLDLLRKEQENLGQKGIYVFHSKHDVNKPIDKASVSIWMRGISKKSGKYCWNYLLRHSRATELYKLAKEGKIAKDTACQFMGHSEDMSNVYTHLDKNDVKKMLKDQIYHLEELPPEEKAEMQKQIDDVTRKYDTLLAMVKELKAKSKN